MRLITDETQIMICQKLLEQKMKEGSFKTIEVNGMAFLDDSTNIQVTWNDAGVWLYSQPVPGDNKYWNSLGLEEPQPGCNLQTTCEINTPLNERGRPQGGFATKDGQVYLIHRGTRMGRLNSAFIRENFKGEWQKLENVGKEVIVIGDLTSAEFLPRLKNFIEERNRLNSIRNYIGQEGYDSNENIAEEVNDLEKDDNSPGEGKIKLTREEYEVFEYFFQYGPIKSAEYLFVGMEEGLGRDSIYDVIKTRSNRIQNTPELVDYLGNERVISQGYYLNDLGEACRLETGLQLSEVKLDSTMSMQAHVKLLLDTNFEFLKVLEKEQQKFRIECFYNTLHAKDSNTAMIDRYPLPCQGGFPYVCDGLFQNKEEYLNYNNNAENPRVKIIENMYDRLPLNVSLVFAGIKQKEFKLKSFYEEMKFQFNGDKSFAEVAPGYEDIVPSVQESASKFTVGKRERPDGQLQYVILTPFLGVGQLSYKELNVITTWVKYLGDKVKNQIITV